MVKCYCPNCMLFLEEGSVCQICGQEDIKKIEIMVESQSKTTAGEGC
ncbi:hypothetical protein [Metabacillus sp. RGM 3146]